MLRIVRIVRLLLRREFLKAKGIYLRISGSIGHGNGVKPSGLPAQSQKSTISCCSVKLMTVSLTLQLLNTSDSIARESADPCKALDGRGEGVQEIQFLPPAPEAERPNHLAGGIVFGQSVGKISIVLANIQLATYY